MSGEFAQTRNPRIIVLSAWKVYAQKAITKERERFGLPGMIQVLL
jgi:hypothetical protein